MIHSNKSTMLLFIFSVCSSQVVFSASDNPSAPEKTFKEQSRQAIDQMKKTGVWIGDSAMSSVQSAEQLWVQRNVMFDRIKNEASVGTDKIEEFKKTGVWIKDSVTSGCLSVGQLGDSAIDGAQSVIQKLNDPEQCWLPAGVIGSFIHHSMLRRGKRNAAVQNMSSSKISGFLRSAGCRVKWFAIPAVAWYSYVNYKEKLKQQQAVVSVNPINASSDQKSKEDFLQVPVAPQVLESKEIPFGVSYAMLFESTPIKSLVSSMGEVSQTVLTEGLPQVPSEVVKLVEVKFEDVLPATLKSLADEASPAALTESLLHMLPALSAPVGPKDTPLA